MPALPPQNLLVILADEHSPKALGCAGHPFVQTPNLDRLAARGTRFTAAYTPSPICVPARAAMATGQALHAMGRYADNADPYDGAIPSWHHMVRAAGHEVVSIGKLHFRGLPGDDHGFTEERLAMHVVEGKGDLLALIRDETAPPRKGAAKMAAGAGPGESDYTRYDRDIAAAAEAWLQAKQGAAPDRPWVLFVSLVTPHFPLTAPPQHFDRYPPEVVGMPKLYAPDQRPTHPFIRDYAATVPYDSGVTDQATVQRMLAGYYGLVSFMDEQVGRILAALEGTGLSGATRVLYTSDHGDNVGARGLWGKSVMYEESASVPMILAGQGVTPGAVCATPVCLTDLAATVLEAVGCATPPPAGSASLFRIAEGAEADRTVLSEYHASGSREAAFLLRDGPYKYVRYATYPPQLFDLAADPEELADLATDPGNALLLARLEIALREKLGGADPAEIDAGVKARQAAILAANGGREAVLARGDLPFSPPPGVTPAWS
ncbi:sulfatase-like hydrolase/transferase [Falsiroseomonas selenitidurans]|uniref:Sulfatase-like hydrolase/transferase n=1 Tax=Falsiroseomonas selenitidurans TaxID=2716335 RepID=A0ABX1E204_9PROT|nr:sulfatase-like hydrolase/transferase [Falsiroseomonas selenitidurans]NKC30735.1 sulfatase-like hydrolase/transferase [Falsiroseomonas selenitidurans]